MDEMQIIDTNTDNIQNYAFCGYKDIEQEGYRRKVDWLKQRFLEGMKFKILLSSDGEAVGFIEYIPGEYTWRAVKAEGYMVIHCIANFYRKNRNKGYGSLLVQECLEDARKQNMDGVAVVARKGTWMASKEIFIKNKFEAVDRAPPDFELLVKRFSNTSLPAFKGNWEQILSQYPHHS